MTIPSTNETWNPERVAQLRAFIGAGMTCSQIAAEIGVTRNAVIGKIYRLGLGPGRPAAALGRPCPPRTRRPRVFSQRRTLRLISADAPLVADGTVVEAESVGGTQYRSLLDLGQGKCRWPVSERPTSDTRRISFFAGSEPWRASLTAPRTRAWPTARRSGGGRNVRRFGDVPLGSWWVRLRLEQDAGVHPNSKAWPA